MNDLRRGWLGGLVCGFGGALLLMVAAIVAIAWEDLK